MTAAEPKPPKVSKTGRKFTVRSVVMELCKAAIEHKIELDNTARSRLAKFPAAVTEVIKDLSVEARDEYEALAEKWNLEGPPREAQLKWVPLSQVHVSVQLFSLQAHRKVAS